MSGHRDDRRVQFTKLMLRDSLIRLLHEKPLSKITIKEICEGASINRGTFYSHFTDQYDLLRYTEETAIEEIGKYITAIAAETSDGGIRKASVSLFRYIKEKEFFWRTLFSKNGSADFYQKLFETGCEHLNTGTDSQSANNDAQWKLTYTFLLIGGIGMIMRWLNEEYTQTPEQAAEIMYKFIKSSKRTQVTNEPLAN